jgi:hypothetical protein
VEPEPKLLSETEKHSHRKLHVVILVSSRKPDQNSGILDAAMGIQGRQKEETEDGACV